LDEKAQALYEFIQERYLWQFYSRTWDREENINGILAEFVRILAGEKPAGNDPKERYFYAEAVTVARETGEKFAWLAGLSGAELQKLVESVRAKLIDTTVIRSQNEELHVAYY
jgi:V-containing nitrogenase delta subunit